MSETSSNCWKTITPARKWVRLSSLTYNAFLSCRGNGVINEAGCWNCLVGMTLGPSTLPRYQRVGGPVRSPHRLAATCQPTANGGRSGGVALLRQSRSALRRSSLGHGHGQAIGARMHGSAAWKTEETIVGLPRLLRFGGCHEWHSVKLNTLGFKVLRRKTPAHRLILNNMISISLDPKPSVSEACSIFYIRRSVYIC